MSNALVKTDSGIAVLDKAETEPRSIFDIDKALRRGGLAYLKEQARELNTTVTHDLGNVITASDDTLANLLVAVQPDGKWQYIYGK